MIGTNFSKADVTARSRFALTKSMLQGAYDAAAENGFHDFLVLSTCNRTEFYASTSVARLRTLVEGMLPIGAGDWDTYFYAETGVNAVRHFFRVVSGLDSQIVGDYEIVGQVKSALDETRDRALAGTIIDRISNFAFRASKKIKTQTNLSNGKYSVSYAAVEWLRHKRSEQPINSVLVVGTGDFGGSAARNLRKHFPDCSITLTNRTADKANALAKELFGRVLPFDNFREGLDDFDAVIITVRLGEYLIRPHHLGSDKSRLFLDLSVPQAVDPLVKKMAGVQLFSVDEISVFHNQWLSERKMEVPEAEQIIEHYLSKLLEWQTVFNHSGIIAGYQEKVGRFLQTNDLPDETVDTSFLGLIKRFRTEGYRGCSVIQTMSEIISDKK